MLVAVTRQLAPHFPPAQVARPCPCGSAHALPQTPQFMLSLLMSVTHAPGCLTSQVSHPAMQVGC